MIPISIINRSTVLPDAMVSATIPSLQTQISRDFAPIWGIGAQLSFTPSSADPPPSNWWLVILDDSDQAGALGYHDLTTAGLPIGKVFAKTDLQYSEPWTLTASHELLEMLADPDINLCALNSGPLNTARLYAYEVCDPCQSLETAYTIDSTLVSDFVYPTWFEELWLNATTPLPQFNHSNTITAPFQLNKGGYISVMDVFTARGWTQLFGSLTLVSPSARPRLGSRRERRRTDRSQWALSTAPTAASAC